MGQDEAGMGVCEALGVESTESGDLLKDSVSSKSTTCGPDSSQDWHQTTLAEVSGPHIKVMHGRRNPKEAGEGHCLLPLGGKVEAPVLWGSRVLLLNSVSTQLAWP